jgi:hypothetical protein
MFIAFSDPLFLSCFMHSGEEFVCHGNCSPDKMLSICLAQKNREMYPQSHSGKLSKDKVPGGVRRRSHVAFFWKWHLCTSTLERQLTDWRERVAAWRDLRGLLCRRSGIVCLLIPSNCTELESSINILIRVARFADCPVEEIEGDPFQSIS